MQIPSSEARVEGGSFRDPSGFVFTRDGVLLRQVNRRYAPHYDHLMESGLYDALVKERLMVPHEEVGPEAAVTEDAHVVLRPERVPFVSYPYEWAFSQLKDAALLTLRVHELALEHGMWLKDASAFNVQFVDGRPVFIDTLSFEKRPEGAPWVAYRQFCEHFLAPLALMARTDVRLGGLLRTHIDGIPLDLAARLLPWRSRLKPGLLMHVHAHARSQKRHADAGLHEGGARPRVSLNALRGLADSLRGTVNALDWRPAGTTWADYYGNTNYDEAAFEAKRALVREFVDRVAPRTVWDLGANTGVFSAIAREAGAWTLAADVDPAAVEQHYRALRENPGPVLPLVLDLTNPTPALGWAHAERDGLAARGPADLVLALALVHHLAIANNVPLAHVAAFFRTLAPRLIVEFVPKSDSQVKRLLRSREDVFDAYTREGFEAAFSAHYRITDVREIAGSERVLYLMEA